MAEQKTFTGAEFVTALAEKKIAEPMVLEGMAKLEDGDKTSFMFSPGTSCAMWVRIPIDIVEQVGLIRVIACNDHSHPLVRLHLKEPPTDNPIAALFASFVKQVGSQQSRSGDPRPKARGSGRGFCYGFDPGCPDSAPCAEEFDGDIYCTDCCVARSPRQGRRVPCQGRPPRSAHARFDNCWYAYQAVHCGDEGVFGYGEDTDQNRDVAEYNAEQDGTAFCRNRGGVLSRGPMYTEIVAC
jgi:hypothetical protein